MESHVAGEQSVAALSGSSVEALIGMYNTMSRIRTCDDRIQTGLQSGEFAFNYYPVRGQEAVAAGVGAHLRDDDYMVTTYRGLHDVISKRVPLFEILAEMLGRTAGTSKGKGGPMHLSDPSRGLMVTSGIVGGALPIACGLGLASKVRGEDGVTVANFGDGATSIGAFHEAMNLAAYWDLPVVFVCQHNGWAEHTRFGGYAKTDLLSDRAAGYGMPGITVDGNSPVAVYDAAGTAIARARSGGGPTMLECKMERLLGHTFLGGLRNMDREQLAIAEQHEPLGTFRSLLVDHHGVQASVLDDIDTRNATDVRIAMDAALRADVPDGATLWDDVFAQSGRMDQ